jgi:hypothetical protein
MTNRTKGFYPYDKDSFEKLANKIKQRAREQKRKDDQAKLIKEAQEDEAYCEVCDISYYADEPCRLH